MLVEAFEVENMAEKNSNCDLCKLVFDNDVKTKIIHKDEICTVTYCSIHKTTPMIVLNRHSVSPSPSESNSIGEVMQRLFPNKKFRGRMQSIKNHWHEHLI